MAMRSHAQLRHPGARLESSNVAAHARTCLWRFFLLLLLERGPSCPLCSTFTNNSPTAKISEHPGIRACRPMRSSIGLTPLRPCGPTRAAYARRSRIGHFCCALARCPLSVSCCRKGGQSRCLQACTASVHGREAANLPVASRLPLSRSSTDE